MLTERGADSSRLAGRAGRSGGRDVAGGHLRGARVGRLADHGRHGGVVDAVLAGRRRRGAHGGAGHGCDLSARLRASCAFTQTGDSLASH